MRKTRKTHTLLRKIIKEVIIQLQKKNKIPVDGPLEYYLNEIFALTLEKCARHFLRNEKLRKSEKQNSLKNKKLRNSEKQALLQLQKDLKLGINITIVEKNLAFNLNKIKPAWGEFFGTDRGAVYNTLTALKEWSCFNDSVRLYYQQQHQQTLKQHVHSQSQTLFKQRTQLQSANRLIQQNNTTNTTLSTKVTQQYIKNQKLESTLRAAKATIATLENQIESHKTSLKTPRQ